MEHRNVYAADPNNPAELARAQEVFQRAVPYSNQAVQAEHEGRFEEAIRLHKLALEIKVRICGEASVQAAVTYNGLGECYLQTQNLDAAEQCLAKALMMLLLEAWDKAHAVSREYYAQLKEAQGHFIDAKTARTRGVADKQMACGNNKKADWKTRHKSLCKQHGAAAKALLQSS